MFELHLLKYAHDLGSYPSVTATPYRCGPLGDRHRCSLTLSSRTLPDSTNSSRHADSKQVLTACDDMQVHLYETSGNLIEAFSGHESWVLSVAAHPDGTHFLSSSSDSSVKLWDIPQRTCVTTSKEHTDQVWAVALSDSGTEVASCGDDGKLVTYNLQ
jgi:WD40 repeat protein